MSTYNSKLALEARQFSGTDNWYKHFLGIVFTDGVSFLREQLECHWLIDDIAIFSRDFWEKESFITADFSHNNDKAVLRLTDGNDHLLFSNKYPYSDLSIDSQSLVASELDPFLRLFLIYDGGFKKHVLLLPSEY